MEVYRNYIDGAWVDAASGRTLEVINPATLEAIARVPDGPGKTRVKMPFRSSFAAFLRARFSLFPLLPTANPR